MDKNVEMNDNTPTHKLIAKKADGEFISLRKTNEQTNAVRGELGRLEDLGLLKKERSGNLLYYQTDKTCPIYEELKNIIIKNIASILFLSNTWDW